MKFSAKTYARAYWQAVTQTPASKHKLIAQNFWQMVWRRGHFKWHKNIMASLRELMRESQGVVLAQVATAQTLTDKEQHELANKLSKAAGRKVELNCVVKPHLLAGMVVTVDDERYDASLKGRLDSLYSQLAGEQ